MNKDNKVQYNDVIDDLKEIEKQLVWSSTDTNTDSKIENLYKELLGYRTEKNKPKKPVSPNVTVKIPTEIGSAHRSITSSQTLLTKMLEFLAKADTRLFNPAFNKVEDKDITMTRDEIAAYLEDMKDLLTQYEKMSVLVKDMLCKLNKKSKELNKDGSLTFEVPREEFKNE